MTMPFRRRVGTTIAALALVVGVASGCTAGDWRPESPPAAGVQQDAGSVKVRNLMVLTDDEDQGLLLGSVFTTEPVEITRVAVSAEQSDGTFGEPVPVGISADVPVESGLMLGDDDSRVEGAALEAGLLAQVSFAFSDGTTMTMQTPVLAAEHDDYQLAWGEVWG